jgi:hypothetical protein
MTVETPEVEMTDEEVEQMRHIIDSDDATERVRAAARRELRKAGRLDDTNGEEAD